jgi:hypothetical protein
VFNCGFIFKAMIAMTNSPTLYQRLLGKDFDSLPLVLRHFHSLPRGGHATGIVTVARSSGVLPALVARVLQLPRAGDEVPLRLQVAPRGDRELWIRHFGRQRLETMQWQNGPYLVEKAGPLILVFHVVADALGMTFHFQHNKISGVQLPNNLSLRVSANARGAGDRWFIAVEISLPALGTITTYRGEITPQLHG